MARNPIFKGITGSVFILGAVSLFTDIASEMLYPVIPIFLTAVLGAPMSVVGLIEGIAESTSSVLKVFSGWLSDLTGRRKPFVVAGYSLSSFAKPLLFFAYSWPVVLLARFIDRTGKGLRTSARDAMIADSTDEAYRGKAFGFHRAMDSIGACIGPLLAIWFLFIFKGDLRLIFLVAFIPAAIGVLILVALLKETGIKNSDKSSALYLSDIERFGPDFNRFLLVSLVFAIGNSSDAFLIIRSKGLGLSMVSVILAYVLYNITYSLFSMPSGIISDRAPRKFVMSAGYMIFAAVYLGFGIVKSPTMVWVLFPVYGVYIAMTDGVGKALVTDMVDPTRVGTALGLYNFLIGIASFLASLIAGVLWSRFGAGAPFVYGAAMAACSSVLFFAWIKARGAK